MADALERHIHGAFFQRRAMGTLMGCFWMSLMAGHKWRTNSWETLGATVLLMIMKWRCLHVFASIRYPDGEAMALHCLHSLLQIR